MKINSFFYAMKQGVRSIFKNKWYSLASIATIGACLLLFGVFFGILANFNHIVKTAEKGVSVTVFFDDGITDERIEEIGNLITARTEVAEVKYVSADQAWEDFKATQSEEFGNGFTENPLARCANYEIYLNDISMQNTLVKYLETVEGIRRINSSAITANTLTGVNSMIGYVSVGIIIILIAVSFFLISNTVTIGISVRKEEITVMKYIGATDFFVRAPFVFEGIIIGIVGAAVPLCLIYVIYNNVVDYIATRFNVLSSLLNFLPLGEVFRTLVPVSFIMGIGIGFLGSFVTVKKHLRV